jgi:hypothetical protein
MQVCLKEGKLSEIPPSFRLLISSCLVNGVSSFKLKLNMAEYFLFHLVYAMNAKTPHLKNDSEVLAHLYQEKLDSSKITNAGFIWSSISLNLYLELILLHSNFFFPKNYERPNGNMPIKLEDENVFNSTVLHGSQSRNGTAETAKRISEMFISFCSRLLLVLDTPGYSSSSFQHPPEFLLNFIYLLTGHFNDMSFCPSAFTEPKYPVWSLLA